MRLQPCNRAVAIALAALLPMDVSFAQDPDRPIDKVQVEAKAPAAGTTRKIIGGQAAPAGKFPFQVALIRAAWPVGQEHFGQFCGGALIDKRWVLTAAHCVPRTRPDEVDVYIGATVLPSGAGSGSGIAGTRRHIVQIVSHQSYDARTHDNDIALLKLDDDAPSNLTPSVWATAELDARFGKPQTPVTVVGWGYTAEGGSTTPVLQEVEVKVQPGAQCEVNYQEVVPSARITQHMFCAGEPAGGKDSCQGDSGGYIGALDGQRSVQLGVVSWGIGCARPKLFGVYTRVADYDAWIKQVMTQF